MDAGFLLQVDDPFLTDILGDATLTAGPGNMTGLDLFVERHQPGRCAASRRTGSGSTPAMASTRGRASTTWPWPRYLTSLGPPGPGRGLCRSKAPTPATSTSTTCGRRCSSRDDRVLLPGVITHASNIVEHPELIAERITRYARLVGRDNVIASADCGFSSQATYRPEIDPRG